MDIALFSPLSLAGATCLVVGALLSIGVGIWTLRSRDQTAHRAGHARAAGIAVGGMLIVAVLVSAVEEEALELNPPFTPEQVASTWRDGKATLTLDPTGSYTCAPPDACDTKGAYGRWRKQGDFELSFEPMHGTSIVERVVSFGGHLRLTRMEDGIDAWSRELTFEDVAR